eukprot:UC4_evm1s604
MIERLNVENVEDTSCLEIYLCDDMGRRSIPQFEVPIVTTFTVVGDQLFCSLPPTVATSAIDPYEGLASVDIAIIKSL